MEIGGLQKLTLIDYPGKIAATVFLIGCNFRCQYCYSSELVLPEKIKRQPKIPQKEFFDFLKERKGFLEAVVVCGGEPTIHRELPGFIKKIKSLGYSVKLDTNGSNPSMLKTLIQDKLIDYVAMDIKAPKEKYQEVGGRKIKVEDIERSIGILKENKVDYEFRTTVVPTLLDKKDILKIVKWIQPGEGLPPKYYLQGFRPEKTVNPKFEKIKPYSQDYLLEIRKIIAPFFEVCEIR